MRSTRVSRMRKPDPTHETVAHLWRVRRERNLPCNQMGGLMSVKKFRCGRYDLRLPGAGQHPLVMGILNVTPDSFSDGGQFVDLAHAIEHAERMIEEGVDIIDIGAESSRPGAEPLPLDLELARVMPVVFALRDCGKPISVDTYKPAVMREVLAAGADMINDIRGFASPEAVNAVADSDCGVCLMHMQNNPQTMQQSPSYDDPVREVTEFLSDRVQALEQAGVERMRICVDPGFGFGKTLDHNLALLRHLPVVRDRLDLPILAGLSRKSMLGAITGRAVEARLAASLSAALIAAERGAAIVRVHDVPQTIDALRVWQAVYREPIGGGAESGISKG